MDTTSQSKLSPLLNALAHKHCNPNDAALVPLTDAEISQSLEQMRGWKLAGKKLEKEFKFPDFKKNMVFINRMAEVAEAEGHHPDFSVHYNKLLVSVWTHTLSGISENDFILAAKIEAISA